MQKDRLSAALPCILAILVGLVAAWQASVIWQARQEWQQFRQREHQVEEMAKDQLEERPSLSPGG